MISKPNQFANRPRFKGKEKDEVRNSKTINLVTNLLTSCYLAFLMTCVCQVANAQQVQATCHEQTTESFTYAMDLGADAIHLKVEFDKNTPVLKSGLLLSEVVKAIEWHTKSYTRYEVKYIINLSQSAQYKEEAKWLYELLDTYIPIDRVTIRSGNYEILNFWHKTYPSIKYELVGNEAKSIDSNLKTLKYHPFSYSIHSNNPKIKENINKLHQLKIRSSVIAVNDTTNINNLSDWKVNFFVTDSISLANEQGLTRKVELHQKLD